MPHVQANGIELYYETIGDDDAPALLLIMGLGAQLVDWPDGFCELLAGRGFRVIRFDNRDAGLSAALDELGVPDVSAVFAGEQAPPYLLADLAADTAALMKAIGVDRAHVVGASMGGMIAQQLTVDRPDLVRSLCSIMSTTGDRTVGHPTPEAAAALGRPPAADRDATLAGMVATSTVLGSPAYPVDPDERLRRATVKYDRAYRPLGTLRQYAAILAAPDRTAALGRVTAPTLVLHGELDPLIGVDGGRATADAVPGAELVVVPGMGHDLPRELWPQVVDAIVRNAGRSG